MAPLQLVVKMPEHHDEMNSIEQSPDVYMWRYHSARTLWALRRGGGGELVGEGARVAPPSQQQSDDAPCHGMEA